MGSTGAEGDTDDSWQCVDCYDTVVHLMLPRTRIALDLEAHWTQDRPELKYSTDERQRDINFEACLDHIPEIPDDYNVDMEDIEVVIDKKKKKTVRRL
jgi:hypothetical protein